MNSSWPDNPYYAERGWSSSISSYEPRERSENRSLLQGKAAAIANRILEALFAKAKGPSDIQEEGKEGFTLFADPLSETFSLSPTETHSARFSFERWGEHAVIVSPSPLEFSPEMNKAITALSLLLSGKSTFQDTIQFMREKLSREQLKEEFHTLDKEKILSLVDGRDKIAGIDAHRITLNGHRYIATCNPAFPARFLSMVLEEKSPLIVKLNGDETPYLPEKISEIKKINGGLLEVKLLSLEKPSKNITIRKLEICSGIKSHLVTHVDFRCWPDFSIPKEADFFILLSIVKAETSTMSSEAPITVHCGAGLGRTGTFITLHSSDNLNDVNFPEIIRELRRQRSSQMVESLAQYIFINDIQRLRT